MESSNRNTPGKNTEKKEQRNLPKTVSSPTALNISTIYLTSGNVTTKPSTSTPNQMSKDESVSCRQSQLYDSGAESLDTDEQTRLIRSPSSRSHKFIIIPCTPPPGAIGTNSLGRPQFRQTFSTSSLATLTAAMQKSLTKTPQERQAMFGSPVPSCISSDVVHDSDPEAVAPKTEGVTFTIEDCESDTPDGVTLEIPHSHDLANRYDNKMLNVSPATKVLTPSPTQLSMATGTTTLSPSSIIMTMGGTTGLQPRNERNSSMRSVVSAYLPGLHDCNQELSNYPFNPHPYEQYMQPTQSYDGKDLSASSYIFHDHGANQIYSDMTSVRSLASIGIGSTDGRRLVIRRVPNNPNELFSLVHPPSPPPHGIDDEDDDSLDLSDEASNLKPRQQHWGNKMQFVLACIGYSVGLGNVWRFPYMCYKSGGGVFLVPYCIILIICSIPLLFMELSVGQYTGRGPIGALGQLCPLFKGAGLASVVVSFLMSTYFSVIIAYSIYYFFTSFKPYMPWINCDNRWNTPDCWIPQRVDNNLTAPNTSRTPSEEFFENKVLQISRGIEYPGMMRWELFACLICAWLMVYFATWKSIKSSAKVRYFTATFPFFLIIILLGRAITLEGADEGLRYFFRPNWSELKHANVWINAASQNFNSLGITFGSMISFASYNKYNNNIVHDTIAVSLVNIITSLLVGVFAFATLGNLALEQNTNVRDVIGDGPGLIFVVYPQAMAKMPYAQLWAVMFFFMLLCLGLNSQFAIVEVVVTSIQDGFPNWIKRHLGYHEIVVLFVCIISFLFGLPNLIQGGIYFFQLIDHYSASVSIMFLAFCQVIAIAWFYGTGRLSKNIKQMTGKAPSFYFKSCWVFFGPCLLFAIWILSLINYQEPSYHNGRYKYPSWAYGIGWMLASFSLICIPGYAIINILRSPGHGFWDRIRNTLRPNIYECKICGEHHCEHDYPEQEQYMLAQEMYKQLKPQPPMQMNFCQKNDYTPMHYQRVQHNAEYAQENNRGEAPSERKSPPTTTTTALAEDPPVDDPLTR